MFKALFDYVPDSNWHDVKFFKTEDKYYLWGFVPRLSGPKLYLVLNNGKLVELAKGGQPAEYAFSFFSILCWNL